MDEVTGDAADLRVGDRLHNNAITGPVVAGPADLIRSRHPGDRYESLDESERSRNIFKRSALCRDTPK